MAARKKRVARKRSATARKPEPEGIVLSPAHLRSLGTIATAVGATLAAAYAVFHWYYGAEQAHRMVEDHDPRLELMEQRVAETEDLWSHARQERAAEVAQGDELRRLLQEGKLKATAPQ